MNEKSKIHQTGGLTRSESEAVGKLKDEVRQCRPDADVVLYGSKTTGECDSESDIDILVILPTDVTPEVRKWFVHLAFEINLAYESNITVLPVSMSEWNDLMLTVTPFHSEIENNGIKL